MGAAKTAVPFFSQGQWRQPSPNHPIDYISLLGFPRVPDLEISSSFTYLVLQKTGTRNKIFKSTSFPEGSGNLAVDLRLVSYSCGTVTNA